MAQQTINVGTAPNDGTGTPLRTAFQYTNSNFSELYTAVGPSGNNIVVPGNATITGDLTVDSGTLKVNSSNDRVGVGTTSPTSKLHVFGAGTNTFLRIGDVGANYNIDLGTQNADIAQLAVFNTTIASGSKDFWLTASSHTFNTWNGSAYSSRFVIASDGVCTWSNVGGVAGTAMTLNSTGLGVGASPSYKLDINGTGRMRYVAGTGAGFYCDSLANPLRYFVGSVSGTENFGLYDGVAGAQRFTINSSGNVGIGVTPSAWFSTWKVLQLAGGSFGGPSDRSFSLQNAIVNASGQFQYVSGSSTPASGYRQFNGAHDWYTAAAGTSPNEITDFATPKMTLESTGSLVLGAAAVATTATDGFLYIPGCAGTPTGTPTAKTGRVPLVVDTTNNKLYFYSGGAWVAAN